jgi:GNAT superfamily N-acetyltransferase
VHDDHAHGLRPTADVFVRPAVADDAATIGAIQLAAWRAAHAATLGDGALALIDTEAVAARWRDAISAPPSRGHHVLVACEGPRVVGLVALAPVPPDDEGGAPGGVVVALEVTPAAQRTGHGSRLLQAAVDTLRGDGADRVTTWVLDGDEARVRFLDGAGLGPDGSTRTLATGPGADGEERTVREWRWGAAI